MEVICWIGREGEIVRVGVKGENGGVDFGGDVRVVVEGGVEYEGRVGMSGGGGRNVFRVGGEGGIGGEVGIDVGVGGGIEVEGWGGVRRVEVWIGGRGEGFVMRGMGGDGW